MNKKIALSIFAIVVLVLSGCDPSEQYPISFKINGTTNWYAASAPCFYSNGKINVNATSTNQSQFITAWQFDNETPGTYPIDHITNHFSYGDTVTGYYAQSTNPATLTVTEFNTSNKKFVGTFSGKLFNSGKTDSILITDGKFDLFYQ
jgi:hypothetical protein